MTNVSLTVSCFIMQLPNTDDADSPSTSSCHYSSLSLTDRDRLSSSVGRDKLFYLCWKKKFSLVYCSIPSSLVCSSSTGSGFLFTKVLAVQSSYFCQSFADGMRKDLAMDCHSLDSSLDKQSTSCLSSHSRLYLDSLAPSGG